MSRLPDDPEGFIRANFTTFLGKDFFRFLGADLEATLTGAAILLVYWLILLWMERRRIFLRV